MRLLLLGCTGFVGKELVPTLLNENHEIYLVSRKPINKLKLDLNFNKFKKNIEIHYTKTCLKNIEKNLYGNNNYKHLKNLIALSDKHL